MAFQTALSQRLGLVHPIIQAPLAGGGDTPDLVAAVSNAGGIGFIGAAYLAPPQIADAARAVRAKTARPFGINLFAPLPAPEAPSDTAPALQRVAPFFAELGLPPPQLPASTGAPFAEQFAAALDSGAAVFSFTFGLLPEAAVASIKARGMLLMGTATTVAEAVALERSGVDAVGVPVVASGGIMDGRGLAAALALGAGAVQLGTAFLTCAEAGIPEAYKAAILAASAHETRLTRAFSGRPARGIVNRFMTEIDRAGGILPFPLQNALTRPMRTAAAKQGKAAYLSLWAGQGARLARRQTATELVARLAAEAEAAVRKLAVSADCREDVGPA